MADGALGADLDVLVIGSGIAGLSVALELAGHRRVAVVAKEPGGGGSTVLAQGGIAAAVAEGDSGAAHAADTVAAAAGLGDPAVAGTVTGEAAAAVARLVQLGARFDTGAPAKEGGHGAARVLHARGDATGAEISHALVQAAARLGVPVLGGLFLLDLLTEAAGLPGAPGRVVGATFYDTETASTRRVLASTTVLATGGYGQLWACTTSPPACSGDGLAAAMRAGAQVADLEFAQFHPTGMDLGLDPRPLASEALRGAGARLRDSAGRYLHDSSGPGYGDLAPRDVVSRSMSRRMAELGTDHCYLDATPIGAGELEGHFPTFLGSCRAAGIDPLSAWAPVSPTAHYTMGGVLTDVDGRTTLEGLMAVGEVGCSGLHGANRLASNSLLEGAVIGARAARAILAADGPAAARPSVDGLEPLPAPEPEASEPLDIRLVGVGPAADRALLRDAMQTYVGVSRSGAGLELVAGALARAAGTGGTAGGPAVDPTARELENMRLVARGVVALALRRRESRGAHWRTDHPSTDERWRVRQVLELAESGQMAVGELPVELPAMAVPPAAGGAE